MPIERSIDFCRIFVDGKRQPGNARVAQALERVNQHDNAFVWLSLKEPTTTQMERIAELFDLHDCIVDDVIDAHQRPKVERYDDQTSSSWSSAPSTTATTKRSPTPARSFPPARCRSWSAPTSPSRSATTHPSPT